MFCHSLPKVALVKSISLVKTKKINLVNMLGGCGWKMSFWARIWTCNSFLKQKKKISAWIWTLDSKKAPFCSPVLYHWGTKLVLLEDKFLHRLISLITDMTGGKIKVEKTENHKFLGKFSLNLANFDKTLFYTSLRPKQRPCWDVCHGMTFSSKI